MEKRKFGNIKDMLTRDQMKQIKGGCGCSVTSCLVGEGGSDICSLVCGQWYVCNTTIAGLPGMCVHYN